MNRREFFRMLPKNDVRFGNLLVIKDKADVTPSPGAMECFLSSVIQFQPLARLSLIDDAGRALELSLTEESSDPVSARRKFEGGGFILSQELAVSGDEASLLIRIETAQGRAKEGAAPRLRLTGSCLFSPQGVPYHWRDESIVEMVGSTPSRIDGYWKHGDLAFQLSASEPFSTLELRPLDEAEIRRTHYFTSFNLKKRYTYWVEEDAARPRPDGREAPLFDSCASVAGRNLAYDATFFLGELDGPRELVVGFRISGRTATEELKAGRRTDRGPVIDGSGAENHRALLRREEAAWDEFILHLPEFRSKDEELERMYYNSWYILRSNRVRFEDDRFPYQFTSVNKLHYYNQFFWDSAYQAIAWLWYDEAGPAQDELKNFVPNQWRNGMIPYELFLYPVNGREWMDGDGTSTGMTQPPVIGIALPEIFRKFGDVEYLAYFYDALLRYEDWLTRYRDLEKRGLSCYMNIWETGWDNSPRLDASARNRVLDPAIESADFNAYIHRMRKTILETARVLGKEAPARIAERMARTTEAMNELMYDPSDGFYHDVVAGTEERIGVKTAAGLIPLITDIPDARRRDRLVKDYLASEKEFLSPCPVPSVSRSEKSYTSFDFWRGANWPQITWTVIYAVAEEASETAGLILERFLKTTKRNTTCHEYYDSETGEGVGLPFQSWGALYTDMVMRFVVGIVPAERGFRFRPLPAGVGDFSVRGVKLKDVSLAVTKEAGIWNFDFGAYGAFSVRGVCPFVAAPTEDRKSIEVLFDPGVSREAVASAEGKGIRFAYRG